jgi:hypothetical protein
MMEENLRRAMKISFGDQMLLITRPILRRLPVRRRRVARLQHAAGAAGQALRGDAGLNNATTVRRSSRSQRAAISPPYFFGCSAGQLASASLKTLIILASFCHTATISCMIG